MLLADEQVTRQRRGRDPPRAPAAPRRRGRARRRVRAPDLRAAGHDPRRLRGGLRARDGQVGGRARRPAAARRGASTRLGVFRPVVADPEHDPLLDLLRRSAPSLPYEASCGVGYEEVRADEARRAGGDRRALPGARRAVRRRAGRRHRLRGRRHGERAGVQRARGAQPRAAGAAGGQRATSARRRRSRRRSSVALTTWRRWGPRGRRRGRQPRARATELDAVADAPASVAGLRAAGGRPADGADGRPGRRGLRRRGDRGRRRSCSGREALHLIVAAMTLPNLMERIDDGAVLITPGDRADVLLAALFAHASTVLPSPAGIVLTGGLRPPETILRPLEGFAGDRRRCAHRARHLRDGVAGGRARGRDRPRRAAQDHQGAGAVRDPRRRRRPARPHRRRRARRRSRR